MSREQRGFSSGGLVCRAGLIAVAVLGALGASAFAVAQSSDPVIFSFATVGDSRQDPASPDPTTLLAMGSAPGATTQFGGAPSLTGTLLPQDKQWLTNTRALVGIVQGIESQGANLLFFNGDMIYGYGRPVLPSTWATTGQPNSWTTAQTLYPDAFFQYTQYAYWRGLVSPLFESGTYVLPVPGNHETQCSYSASPFGSGTSANPNCNSKTAVQSNTASGAPPVTTFINGLGKTAYAENENAFRNNVGDLITDLVSNYRFSDVTGYYPQNVSGLTAATAATASTNNGAITGSQIDLTYSFDLTVASGLILHFAVINTDPSGADSTAPADWLASDFSAAYARGASHFFVFGHKPAFTYNYNADDGEAADANAGLDGLPNYSGGTISSPVTYNLSYRNAFWAVMAEYGATYFSGHEHTVNVNTFADPTGTWATQPFQVIVGSGGSPFDDKLVGTCSSTPNSCTEPTPFANPSDRYYAWALVQVHQSGNVSLYVSGFNDQFGPTQDLTWYNQSTLQPANAAALAVANPVSGGGAAAKPKKTQTKRGSAVAEPQIDRPGDR
jgi:hypothetical protein